ncbi:MAG: tetratricopeptide repeat protein [Candidatus Omnitrophota bacterium]
MLGPISIKNKIVVITSLSVFGLIIYSNTFYCPFQFDDTLFIVSNFSIRSPLNLHDIWVSYSTRFLTFLSFLFNYSIGRLDVFSYHAVNLFIHLSNAFLVWWLAVLTFRTPAIENSKISYYSYEIAFFSSLIFLCHPVQTESVTYIWQRSASLSAFFYLLSLALYVKSRLGECNDKGAIKIKVPYTLSLLAFFLGMFTKENIVTLPIIIALYELTFLNKDKKNNWKAVLPFLLLAFLIPALLFLGNTRDFMTAKKIIEKDSIINCFSLTQPRAIVTYIRLLFIPINQNLDYDYTVTKSLLEIPALLSMGGLLSILAAAIIFLKKYRVFSFSILWFFITLLPEASIIPLRDVIFEHRMYLPLAGYAVFIASLGYYFFGKDHRKLLAVFFTIITIFYAGLTYTRNAIWKDSLTLWSDVVSKSPNKARPYINRGVAYTNLGFLDKAILDYNKALAICPSSAEAHNNLGFTYYTKGDYPKAIIEYGKALEIRPLYADAHNNLGRVYYEEGFLANAIEEYSEAIKSDPDNAMAYTNRGLAFMGLNEFLRACRDFDKAIAIDPLSFEAYSNRGIVYAESGHIDKAIADFDKAVAIRPNSGEAYTNRSIAYLRGGRHAESLKDAEEAERLGARRSANSLK